MNKQYDVLIMGGGLAGLTLAIQLKRRLESLKILIIEKASHPAPEAAHKVGESSVEIASHYFEKVLGLEQPLENELPKLGLRFFYSDQNNQDITKRVELGPYHFPPAKSYQLDRGRFENALAKQCTQLGIDFQDNTKVKQIHLAKHAHQLDLDQNGEIQTVQGKWLIDASGRMALLKRHLKLARPAYHDINASWFRIAHEINIDQWTDDKQWQDRVAAPRRLSTNHLMGHGYWVWLIPLASGATSIGIVADAKIHPYAEINTFARAQTWLAKHEPQCAAMIEQHKAQLQDFLTLKHYSHNCKQMYSADGWAITGDAGVFLDPFYSPGSDFIALNNTFISELIVQQQTGNDISPAVKQYEKLFRTLFIAFCPVYEDQYPIMGNAKVMSIKIIWDYTLYWSGAALLFFRDKFCDIEFMNANSQFLQRIYQLNIKMQAFFRHWAELDHSSDALNDVFINYSNIQFLQQLNKDLLQEQNDAQISQQLSDNIALIAELSNEIIVQAVSDCEPLAAHAPATQTQSSDYLHDVFNLFKPA
ncbi:MAG: NAD(P)-binding protein [Methyloprofundus sp.]|nr:NAD(P)-binding protein [Methyloprofundus sp.]